MAFNIKLQSRVSKSRSRSAGAYLVETLVALTVGSLFAYALLNMLSETMRLTSSNENRQTADFITQSILDSVKRADPSQLQIGSYQLLVNSQSAGERGPSIHPLPACLNLGDFNWNTKSISNKFSGQVLLDIEPGNGSAKSAVVTVIWSDGSNIMQKKTGTLTTLYPKGVNFWP